MKIKECLTYVLCEMDPSYKEYVIYENNIKVLYVHITKAIYGLLESAMLFHKNFSQDLICNMRTSKKEKEISLVM
jgi:hypothetical protein